MVGLVESVWSFLWMLLLYAMKTHLVVKTEYLSETECIFVDISENITNQGHHYLSPAIGQNSYVEQFVKESVWVWQKICQLSILQRESSNQPLRYSLMGLSGSGATWPELPLTFLTYGALGNHHYLFETTATTDRTGLSRSFREESLYTTHTDGWYMALPFLLKILFISSPSPKLSVLCW